MGADVRAKDNEEKIALHFAAEYALISPLPISYAIRYFLSKFTLQIDIQGNKIVSLCAIKCNSPFISKQKGFVHTFGSIKVYGIAHTL